MTHMATTRRESNQGQANQKSYGTHVLKRSLSTFRREVSCQDVRSFFMPLQLGFLSFLKVLSS